MGAEEREGRRASAKTNCGAAYIYIFFLNKLTLHRISLQNPRRYCISFVKSFVRTILTKHPIP